MFYDDWDEDFFEDYPRVKKTSRLKQKMMAALVMFLVLSVIGLSMFIVIGRNNGGNSSSDVTNPYAYRNGVFVLTMIESPDNIQYSEFEIVDGVGAIYFFVIWEVVEITPTMIRLFVESDAEYARFYYCEELGKFLMLCNDKQELLDYYFIRRIGDLPN